MSCVARPMRVVYVLPVEVSLPRRETVCLLEAGAFEKHGFAKLGR